MSIKTKAILAINSNASFVMLDDDLDQITWENGTTPISKADIEAKVAELPTEEQEKTTKATNKTNAIAKLKASTWSPLTDDEATALFGE